MTAQRQALTRQNLTRLLAELRAQGVQAAQFHPDGRLASVSFGFAPTGDAESAGDDEPEAKRTTATRHHLAVLRGLDPEKRA